MGKRDVITSKKPLHKLVSTMLTTGSLWEAGALPISAHFTAGHAQVLFVAGENCSGKSYFVENLRIWAKHLVKEGCSICVSIRERTGAGLSDMAGMRKAMMFGDEAEQSTGATSVNVLGTAFRTLQARADENAKALLVLDEPEIGLSEGYTAALGTWLGQRLREVSPECIGVVIVSHSRALARAMAAEIGTPSFVHMGKPLDFETWVSSTEAHTVDELLQLGTTGHKVRKEIWACEEALKKALKG